MSTPLVSVLMTAYNREKYIAAAIESVLASTYANFELIITDDRSADKTVDIARAYAAKDQRVKVFLNEQNLGDYPNRNKAASHATGEYLKYVDADDAIYPWGLEILVNCMEKFPAAGYGLCSLSPDKQQPFPFQLSPVEAYRYQYFGPGLFHKAPLSSIIRRSAFENAKGFSPIRMAGDYDMWHRLSTVVPVVLMPHGIVWYRQHDSQEMNVYHKFEQVYNQVCYTALNNAGCPLTSKEINTVKQRYQSRYGRKALKNLARLNFSAARRYWKLKKEFSPE